MTVIAWDGKTLASDSMMTDDCGVTSVTKIWRLKDGRLFGGAGSAGYVALVRDWLMTGGNLKTRPDCARYEHAYFGGILIQHGECLALDGYLSTMKITAPHYAIGSGAAQVNALMASGMTSEQAVRTVIEKQLADGVGGAVQTLALHRRKPRKR
jgi:uncharacterized protein YoaH (UPF0181 family)